MKRLTQHGPLQRSRTFSGPTRRAVGLIITGVLFIALITTIAGRSEFGLTAGSGPAFVQGAAQTTNGTNLTTTYSNDVTAGDLLVAVFRTPGGTAVSDQLNGAWTEATGNNLYSIWYLPNAKAGRTSVTVTATSGALRAGIAEYSGMAVSSVFDAGSCNIGWGTTMTTGNTAPIGTGELVFAGGGTLNTSINVSAGSSNGVTATLRDQATGAAGTIGDEDITQAAPGVQNASMTLSAAGTNGWNACVATFRSVLSPGPTPTPAPTFPPLSGGLLPGQQIWKNGVSSYLFGTNDTEEWQGNNVETNSTVQGYLKRGGLPLMRSFFFHNSLNGGHENTDADIQRRINAITNSGMNCLGVIPNILLQSAPAPGNSYTDLGWAEHLVSLLDGTHPGYQECDMYEIGNEPDLTPDASNYVTEWNAFVPALRAINPRAKFFGPASYTINYGYIQWFLQGTVASGVQPDGVTFHRYGCGGTDTNLCLQMAALYGDRVNTVRTIVVNTLHKNIPIGITEWNMDPGSNNVLAGNDQFMRDFTTTSLNSMIAAHLDFANQFDAMSFAGYGTLDMFNINTSQPKAQFWAMVGVLQQNGGPSTLPLPTLAPTLTPIATVTVTASPSPSPPPSPTVTMTPPPSPTPGSTLAQDTFQRPNQALWGTASDGHTWGGDANVQSVFSISNNTGQVSNSTTTYSAVLGPVATDAEVLFTGSMSSYSNTNLGAVLRWTDGNNWYKAYINGTTLVVQKKVNGATTILGSTPFPATAGTSYILRFRVVGTTLYARVWQTGTTEPANWMIMVTDSSFSSGYCGLRMLAQNGATASYTSFLATAE